MGSPLLPSLFSFFLEKEVGGERRVAGGRRRAMGGEMQC